MPRRPQEQWTVLADHVAPYRDETGPVSTFVLALREARSCLGRDVDSGRPGSGTPIHLWAGSVVYLVLLEQIGKSLRPKGSRDVQGEWELERAIRQFAPNRTTPYQRNTLYALRCAFAHEFGLFNIRRNRPSYQHLFRLDDDPTCSLVKRPARRWSGDYNDTGIAVSTTVGLIALGDLTEEVVRSVRTHSNQTTLRSRLAPGELQRRFSVFIHD